jgi:hypothetical protein
MDEDDSKPLGVADPSPLTTSALLREIANLKEFVITRFDGVGTRLDAMDKAMVLFSDNLVRVPTDTDKQVGHLKELHDQRFDSLQRQLDDMKQAGANALAAALQAQKELAAAQDAANAAAINKSQAATDKQIDAIAELLKSGLNASNDKIAIINGRLDKGEGGHGAVREHATDRRLDAGMLISIGLFLIAVASVAIAIMK